MHPVNRRRLANFKSNKRGYYSLCLFGILFTISLFAEFVANDKPILMSINDKLYFPVWFANSEAEIGGVMETETEYLEQICAGDTLVVSSKGADLTVRSSRSLGKMLIVTSEATYRNQQTGNVAAIQRSQAIFY